MDRKERIKMNIYKELLEEEKRKNKFITRGVTSLALLVLFIAPFMVESGKKVTNVEKSTYVSIEKSYNDFFEEETVYTMEDQYSELFENDNL